MANREIPLGVTGRDKISGFEGIVSERVEYLDGTLQYALRPRELDKSGELAKGYCFDFQQLEIINDDIPEWVIDSTTVEQPLFTLGTKLKDTASGLVGIAVSCCDYLNGCKHYGLKPEYDKEKNKIPDTQYVPAVRLELVEEKTRATEKVQQNQSTASKRPGCSSHPDAP